MSLETISVFHEGLDKALEWLGKQNIRLKECQYEAVKAVVIEKKDTMCVLPAGYGKSLIYQLLPTVFDVYLDCEESSCVIVILPLNALMVDQIAKLKEHMDVSVLKTTRREAKYDSNTDMQIDVGSVYEEIACRSKIIFAQPEALLEDKKVFQNVLKSKEYQDSVMRGEIWQ